MCKLNPLGTDRFKIHFQAGFTLRNESGVFISDANFKTWEPVTELPCAACSPAHMPPSLPGN